MPHLPLWVWVPIAVVGYTLLVALPLGILTGRRIRRTNPRKKGQR
jgi:Flp pilus assembly protein TadB